MTIGISVVACLAAIMAGVVWATTDVALQTNEFVSQYTQALRPLAASAERNANSASSPRDVAALAQARLELAPEWFRIGGNKNTNSGQLALRTRGRVATLRRRRRRQ